MTVTLGYNKNIVVVLTETIKTTFTQTATVTTTTMIPPNTTVISNPVDWTGLLSSLGSIITILGLALGALKKLKERLKQRKAYEPLDYSVHPNNS